MKHYVENKVIIVTGGSSGFGRESARLLLEMGAKVVITGRNQERLDRAQGELSSDRLLAVRADAVSSADWHALIQATLDRFARLDVLVNNHGAGVKIAPVDDMEDEAIQAVIETNLISVIKGCREAVKVMKPRGSGQIVNVSNGCAHYSWPAWGVYTAAKAGLVAFTRCLHKEIAHGTVRQGFFSASRASTPSTIFRRFGSALAAVARISSMFTGWRASGRHRSVMIESPKTRIPAWTATITSGTVDMPTTSAPIARKNRYSARVSRFGPVTAT